MMNDFNQNNLNGSQQTGLPFLYPLMGAVIADDIIEGTDSNEVFNDLIKSQEVMVESYARIIGDVKSKELKELLKTAQERHFKKMMVFSDRLYEIGGNPDFHVGLRGALDDLRHRLDRRNDVTDLEIARIALKAEMLNAEKLAAQDREGVDPTSHEIFGAAIHFNEENIQMLEEYIKNEEARLH